MWTVCASVIFLLALLCVLHLMFFILYEEDLKYTLFQDIFAMLEWRQGSLGVKLIGD